MLSQLFQAQNFGLPEFFDKKPKLLEGSLPTEIDFSKIMEAPIDSPEQFCPSLKNMKGPEKRIMDFKKGTTCLGFVFQGGVLLAVDSRASQGAFDASEHVRKIIEINDRILGTMAGGAADCAYWEALLGIELRKYELKYGEKLTVAGASRILINILHHYKNYGLSMGVMLAGYDKNGPNLYYLDDDGTRLKGNIFSIGSGSTYAYGVLDTYYNHDMTLPEAVELGKRAIQHATYRDAGSGGVVRVYHIHKDGWTKIEEGLDVNVLHYKYAEEKGLDGTGDLTNQKLY